MYACQSLGLPATETRLIQCREPFLSGCRQWLRWALLYEEHFSIASSCFRDLPGCVPGGFRPPKLWKSEYVPMRGILEDTIVTHRSQSLDEKALLTLRHPWGSAHFPSWLLGLITTTLVHNVRQVAHEFRLDDRTYLGNWASRDCDSRSRIRPWYVLCLLQSIVTWVRCGTFCRSSSTHVPRCREQ